MAQETINGDIDHCLNRPRSHRLLYLDGWRGLCIISVLIGHFGPIHFIDFGSLGVEMFFVLSGRLMADILFIEKFPLRHFFIRRFSRVWPGLSVYVIFCALVFFNIKGFLHVSFAAAIAALTFTTNYKVFIFGETQLLDHTWSLCVEEHSYIILGIFALFFRKHRLSAVKYYILAFAIVMAVNGLLRTYLFPMKIMDFPGEEFDIYWLSDIHCASVFFAVFTYLNLKTIAVPPRDYSKAALLLLGLGFIAFAGSTPETLNYTVGTMCLGCAVCAFEVSQYLQRLLSQKFLILLGTYSFSIYIWQQLFYKLFQDLRSTGALTQMQGAIWRPAFVTLACAAGIACYYVVEKPSRKYINERWAFSRAQNFPNTIQAPLSTG